MREDHYRPSARFRVGGKERCIFEDGNRPGKYLFRSASDFLSRRRAAYEITSASKLPAPRNRVYAEKYPRCGGGTF